MDECIKIEAAIFDEHHGEAEGLDMNFDERALRKIIDACNRRIEETGDTPPIIDRHTSEDPNDPEPDILGYADNFRLGTLGNKIKRKAIYATLNIHKDKWSKARNLRRRSIELWPDMVVDPVVLHGESPIDCVALLWIRKTCPRFRTYEIIEG